MIYHKKKRYKIKQSVNLIFNNIFRDKKDGFFMKDIKFSNISIHNFLPLQIEQDIDSAINHYLKALESSNKETISWQQCVYPLMALGELYSVDKYTARVAPIIVDYVNRVRTSFTSNSFSAMPPLSLFGGLCELGMAISIVNQNSSMYPTLLDSVNKIIFGEVSSYLKQLNAVMNSGKLYVKNYDSISGASGIFAYLQLVDHPMKLKLSSDFLSYFIRLLGFREDNGVVIPNGVIHPNCYTVYDDPDLFPSGLLNFSLSHGIAGPLASIALGYREQPFHDSEKAHDILESTLAFYKRWAHFNCDGIPYWVGQVKLEDLKQQAYESGEKSVNNRMSWCYGSIGILRSMQLAARAIENKDIDQWCFEKLIDISSMKIDDYKLSSPTICHGFAGLIDVLIIIYKESPTLDLRENIIRITEVLLSYYDITSTFGFKNTDISLKKGYPEYETTDTADFLCGTTGVILTLISLIKDDTTFQRHLLLS